ncbi:MAG: winged helix-turn-helix domain-containing protein [Gemmatimonadetes bacterium]|nr:winged helix-turn-helix domain-containing protein [Gemmatimonadota bacterium]
MGRRIPAVDDYPNLAARFRALADPTRLQLLSLLQDGEQTVSELVDRSGQGQANVSKHLQQLHGQGFVTRRKAGLFVHYGLADRRLMRLCAQLQAIPANGASVAGRSVGR